MPLQKIFNNEKWSFYHNLSSPKICPKMGRHTDPGTPALPLAIDSSDMLWRKNWSKLIGWHSKLKKGDFSPWGFPYWIFTNNKRKLAISNGNSPISKNLTYYQEKFHFWSKIFVALTKQFFYGLIKSFYVGMSQKAKLCTEMFWSSRQIQSWGLFGR